MGRRRNESAFTRWFCKMIERVNGVTFAFVGSTMQGSGIPDRYICHKKFRGWIEFKKDDYKLSKLQKLTLQSLHERGDVALVIRYRNDELMHIENYKGELLKWVDLRPMYAVGDQRCAVALIAVLSEFSTPQN